MNKYLIAAIGVFVSLIVVLSIGTVYLTTTYNQEQQLKTLYDAKIKANSADFDNMWKKISQSYKVADANKEALKEVFTGYASARTGNGSKDPAMVWIKEAIPNADLTIYRKTERKPTSL